MTAFDAAWSVVKGIKAFKSRHWDVCRNAKWTYWVGTNDPAFGYHVYRGRTDNVDDGGKETGYTGITERTLNGARRAARAEMAIDEDPEGHGYDSE
tara:strand:- start:357 stop:644 length:288 start_codon:yes stop_codon:yes gene_type:complete